MEGEEAQGKAAQENNGAGEEGVWEGKAIPRYLSPFLFLTHCCPVRFLFLTPKGNPDTDSKERQRKKTMVQGKRAYGKEKPKLWK